MKPAKVAQYTRFLEPPPPGHMDIDTGYQNPEITI